MKYVGIDWGTRRAAWCSFDERGEMTEGAVSADADGLARLVHTVGPDAYGCVEMMSGAVWVREQLQACGWRFAVADARKVKAIAPLACKTDKVDARVLAQLAARDLEERVPAPLRAWRRASHDRPGRSEPLSKNQKRSLNTVMNRTVVRECHDRDFWGLGANRVGR